MVLYICLCLNILYVYCSVFYEKMFTDDFISKLVYVFISHKHIWVNLNIIIELTVINNTYGIIGE